MDNHYKGKSTASNNNNIDLTLKLGLSNAHYYDHKQVSDQETSYAATKNFTPMDAPLGYKNYEYNMHGGGAEYINSLVIDEASYPWMCYATPSRGRRHGDNGRFCRVCGINDTPLWRKGPAGPQTLCNACGLKHLRTTKRNL